MRSLRFYVCRCSVTSCVWLFETQWTVAHQASLSFTIAWSFLKFPCIESVLLSSHLILCCRLLLLPSIFPSIRVLSNESAVRVCVCVCVCDIVIYKQWWCYFFLCNLDSYYFCLCFFSFFCLIAVTSTSSGLPWWLRWVMRVGILVLLPVLGEIFSAFHHWWCLLWVCLFIMLRYVPSPHSLLIIFVINRCWILSEAFPASIIWSYDFYSLIC